VLKIDGKSTKDSLMAEQEVEAAWRAEFKRSGATELHDASNSVGGSTDELKRQAAFRWPGDEAEARRLQQEKTYHYVRWILLVGVAAVIAGLIAVGLAQLR
jgi:hypothetical protein